MDSPKNSAGRRYDLDWLRVLAIILVLIYHVGMYFNTWWYHIKSPNTTPAIEGVMIWLHQWRMPLLLFISGAATFYASSKRSVGGIISERSHRLLIPLVFSILVIVPPQIYFERINQYSGYLDFYKTVFQFVPYPAGGSLSWHHMWFVLYLFLYSLIGIPLLKFIKSETSAGFILRIENLFEHKIILPACAFFIVISQILLRPVFPNETHALIDDWAYFIQYGMFYWAGLLFSSSTEIWKVIQENRKYHFNIALVSLLLMFAFYYYLWSPVSEIISEEITRILWEINLIFLGWTWVITILGYGKKYLNRESKLVKQANEGIYPFYILHQSVLITVAYYYSKIDTGILSGFVIIFLVTGISSALIYWYMIKPFKWMRYLFGMKLKSVKQREVPAIKFNATE